MLFACQVSVPASRSNLPLPSAARQSSLKDTNGCTSQCPGTLATSIILWSLPPIKECHAVERAFDIVHMVGFQKTSSSFLAFRTVKITFPANMGFVHKRSVPPISKHLVISCDIKYSSISWALRQRNFIFFEMARPSSLAISPAPWLTTVAPTRMPPVARITWASKQIGDFGGPRVKITIMIVVTCGNPWWINTPCQFHFLKSSHFSLASKLWLGIHFLVHTALVHSTMASYKKPRVDMWTTSVKTTQQLRNRTHCRVFFETFVYFGSRQTFLQMLPARRMGDVGNMFWVAPWGWVCELPMP